MSEHRAFRCPKCGGEFDEWEKFVSPSDLNDIRVFKCPFCGQEKGAYQPLAPVPYVPWYPYINPVPTYGPPYTVTYDDGTRQP